MLHLQCELFWLYILLRKYVKAAQAVSSSTVDNEVIYSIECTDKVNYMAQLRLQWQRIIQPKVGGGRDGRMAL